MTAPILTQAVPLTTYYAAQDGRVHLCWACGRSFGRAALLVRGLRLALAALGVLAVGAVMFLSLCGVTP